MKLADFDYDLPPHYIAQRPLAQRDAAKLLRLDRASGEISHHIFSDILALLKPPDVLVMNNTRVIPARLRAVKAKTGGAVEILLLRRVAGRRWRALVGGRNVRAGLRLRLADGALSCTVVKQLEKAERLIEFDQPIDGRLADLGEMPLPPYISAPLPESERYQTVYSAVAGSAAAPTAGLHFTPALLSQLQQKGIKLAYCTLHIGLDTFQPVTAATVRQHKIHSEYARLDAANAEIINAGKQAGGRIIAVGTTSARTLETAAGLSAPDSNSNDGVWAPLRPFEANTELFIYPGYQWRAVDAMISNFHLPRSTLLMMLSAFAGRETLLAAYERAKEMQYRFYSFGDAMFIE